MDLIDIRRHIITAVASDEMLEMLVLKGGNALEIVHKIGQRASLDVDYSLDGELQDVPETGRRLEAALKARFEANGFIVFDFEFGPRPATATLGERWGGYLANFKLITRALAERVGHIPKEMSRQSQVIGATSQERKFRIEISRYEFTAAAETIEVDFFPVRVYTAPMLAIEKLRALCQQMPGYLQRKHPTPRPRDFYDIHEIVKARGIQLTSPANMELVRAIFAAKQVDPASLVNLRNHREFHSAAWGEVQQTVASATLPEFDYYFDYVVHLSRAVLQALGHIDTPV